MHFGLRGRQEHTDMCWGDIELQTDAEGSEYLLFTERATKTRHGVSRLTRLFQPKMFATDWSDDDTFESMDIDVLDSDVSSRIASVPLNDISNNIASPRPDAPTANHTLSFLNRATINGNITINIHKH